MDELMRRRIAVLRGFNARQLSIFKDLCVARPREEIALRHNASVRTIDREIQAIKDAVGADDPAYLALTAAQRRLALRRFYKLLAYLDAEAEPPPPEEPAAPPEDPAPAPGTPAALARFVADAAGVDPPPTALVALPRADADDGTFPPSRPWEGAPAGRGRAGRPWLATLGLVLVLVALLGAGGDLLGRRLAAPTPASVPATTPTAMPVAADAAAAAAAEPTASSASTLGTTSAAASATAVPTAAVAATTSAATGPTSATTTPVTAASASTATITTARSVAATASAAAPTGPAPAPTVVVGVDPAAPPRDLAGTVASDLPGTPLALGHAVTSVIDAQSKRRDVYALQLPAGERFHLAVQASSPDFAATFGPAGALPLGLRGVTLCSDLDVAKTCDASLPIAASGGYLLLVQATGPGVRYTLQPSTLPLPAPAGATFLAGRAASNIPGTPLALGRPVFSVVDQDAKPADAYALRLRTGQTLRVQLSATPSEAVVRLLPPGAAPFTGAPSAAGGTTLCNGPFQFGPCDQTFPIAQGGDYTLLVEAGAPGMQYTLQATAQ